MSTTSKSKRAPRLITGGEPAPPAKPDPTEGQAAAIEQAASRYSKLTRRLEISMEKEGAAIAIDAPHSDDPGFVRQQFAAFGSTSAGFVQAEMRRLINAVCSGEPEQDQLNAALAVVDGIQPENEVEAMLACQMAATHALTMTMMGRATRAGLIPQMEASGNLAVKLSRTFVAQVEALAKLRKPPEQRVVVEHVHIHPGAQAVVGNVNHTTPTGGGVAIESGHQSHATDDVRALGFATGPEMWGEDPQREAVPVAGSVRKMPVPDARRIRRGAAG